MRRVVVGCITVVVVLTIQPLVRIVTITAQQPTTTTTTATPPPLSTKYLLIGVSGGLQDGFPERSKMDYVQYDDVTNTTITITPAIFIGKALIRGYKAFLDVMESGYRQYVVTINLLRFFLFVLIFVSIHLTINVIAISFRIQNNAIRKILPYLSIHMIMPPKGRTESTIDQ